MSTSRHQEVNPHDVIGAAMVVGGGIAGMQASLDLADQGYKVYLVEKESAIGGKMAQLDKTFPTNDCAMCTISPKLVETGRHPNIELITNAEVLDVSGSVGNFSVRVQQQPRYVNADACVACNDCVEVCPVIIPDIFNEGLSTRHAVYKQYPQAVPNAFAIQKAGIAPCRDACPAGQRAQGYIALIRESRWEDALRVIKMDNPFPGICGRICNHRCEDACNRGKFDEPINIRALKRFVTDKVYETPRDPVEPAEIHHPEQRAAVIGAGPCGLTAAQDLILAGYPVSVFEAMPVAGGMLRLGVPEYRLPTEIIEREVQDIIDLGVDLRLNHRVDDLDELFELGFQAVLIAVGAHEGVRLPIPGSQLDGVIINTRFLRDVRLGKYSDQARDLGLPLGECVLVLGGGNVAIDCARTAVRLGKTVHLACLENREEMPAHNWEIEAAEQEGVILHPSRSFERILGDDNGRVRGMELQKVARFSFNESGGLHVEKVPESQHEIPCDTVIFSVGQRAGLAFIPDDAGVGVTDQQTIAINPNTLAATREGVFAAGDSVSGTAFVIESVASGHTAARSMQRYLEGKHLEPPWKPTLPVVELSEQEIQDRQARGEISPQPRVPMPELDISQRVNNFAEVESGYNEESARAEAARCLACGICSECMSCVFACGRDAIDHDMVASERTLPVGGIILAPGYQTYQAELSEEFGFGRYPNVITSLQYERLLSASGPTMGHIERPSDQKTPRRIAFLQCIGSRDQQHDYCSSVCCMYATKEALITRDHYPETEIEIFFMDNRAFSKGYLEYFQRARDHYGIRYHHCRISEIKQDPSTGNLILRCPPENGRASAPVEEEFDLVVLSVGMEIADSVQALARQLGIELDEYGFCHTVSFNPVETSRPGIYAAGPFREPKDIPESIMEASGAAGGIGTHLGQARFSLTQQREYPPEKDVSAQKPRVGVFICHCGSNIGGYLDVPAVTDYAGNLPNVVHAESNLYTCSQDSIKHITDTVLEKDLNRVVVASCTPLTHQPLFQDSIRNAGLNPYLFEMANIRNQCSWVHSHDWDQATQKAKELVRMSAAKAARLQPQKTIDVPVTKTALVVGGGATGMTAALTLAESGFPVDLIEKEDQLGGQLRQLYLSQTDQDPQAVLERLIRDVDNHPDITVHLGTRVVDNTGFKGNFTTTAADASGKHEEITHGATILATGAEMFQGAEYGYGSHPSVINQQDLEAILTNRRPSPCGGEPKSVTMIQCIGPAERYCSRICCTTALKNALAVKQHHPETQVTILYKDIRVFGLKEQLYTQARREGVLFVRYDDDHPPQLIEEREGKPLSQPLTIRVRESKLNAYLELEADLLVLSLPMIPSTDSQELANLFKVSLGAEGYFMEAHVKLRPVDFATEGVFMAGMAHYPKLLDESMIQAQAAASRAAIVLSKDHLKAGGRVAQVDQQKCTGCLTCLRICPFEVPVMQAEAAGIGRLQGAAYIEPAVCQGCGSCAAECPAKAIELMHFTDLQLKAKAHALLHPELPQEITILPDQENWKNTIPDYSDPCKETAS